MNLGSIEVAAKLFNERLVNGVVTHCLHFRLFYGHTITREEVVMARRQFVDMCDLQPDEILKARFYDIAVKGQIRELEAHVEHLLAVTG